MRLISELKRRNVLRMAVLYAVAAWLIMQVAEVVIALAELPGWSGQIVLVMLAIGFPIALIFSWFYELTPEGITLEKDVDRAESITHITGRRMDFIVISLLSAAVILFAWHIWWPSVPSDKSIAVMAFENISGDPEQEYFCDGISEELLNTLAKVPELRVISRPSAFAFKGKDVAVPEIAKQLDVAHVLAGSVRKEGDRVRITAQLIEARSDSHIWAETYDREYEDIFAIQQEIAAAISDALKIRLTYGPGEKGAPVVIKSANLIAYDEYLRGRELIRQRDPEAALRHLERSLRLDVGFAPAHAALAIAHILHNRNSGSRLEKAEPKINLHLDRARALEPNLPETFGARALLAGISGDPASAIEHAEKALALNPNYSDALNWLQINLARLGRYAEADSVLEQLIVLDPISPVGNWNYVELLCMNGRIDEARDVANWLLKQEQDPVWGYRAHFERSYSYEGKLAEGLAWALKGGRELGGHRWPMFVFLSVGEYDEARRIAGDQSFWMDVFEGRIEDAIRSTQRNMRADPDNPRDIADAAYVLYLAGRIDEALPLYERLMAFVPEGRPIPGYLPVAQTMRLALARRQAGNEEGAQAAADIVRQDIAAQRGAGRKNHELDQYEAMLAAFESDTDRVVAALGSFIETGLKEPWFLDDPIFKNYWAEPRFVALRQEFDTRHAAEHDKILQLICFTNPVPDDWQPLPETCEGVVKRLIS